MNMKMLRLSLLFILGLFAQRTSAQCQYTLQMYDSYGDGWNGGVLTITNGTTVNNVTMVGQGVFNTPIDSTLLFTVIDGQPLSFSWVAGGFIFEVSFEIYDDEGNLVFSANAPPDGTLFSGIASCPSCLKPSNLQVENVYDTRAKLRWSANPASTAVNWRVIYGPRGFVPGPGVGDTLTATQPKATLTGLQKKSPYDWYVQQDCGNNDFSALAGPSSFDTYWTNDVGISAILTPLSACDLGLEVVKIAMNNYGAAPQSLIPFDYSVNGISAGVPQPNDGFYTGVLGKDSSEVIEFETTFDFSAPGEYLIAAWTTILGDEDTSNDTTYFRINNRLLTPYSQNFETWNGGWSVDSSSVNPSWAFGDPEKFLLDTAASGVNAWVTSLNTPYNNAETSFLLSPCFDFSALSTDPVIEFSLFYDLEADYDGAILELSIDDGATWEKVGLVGEGFNWYNVDDTNTQPGDAWNGQSNGWVTARHGLPGTAGESTVKLRFGFFSDPFGQFEGVGIDDVRIYIPLAKDLAGLSVSSTGDATLCGLEQDKVVFSYINFGSQPQAFYSVAYSINGGTPVVESVGANIIQPDETFSYTFTTPFDSRDGAFTIKAWTILTGELATQNDTAAVYKVNHVPKPVPFQYNFEDGQVPADWIITTDGFAAVTNAHNNISNVLALNLFSGFFGGVTSFVYDLPRYGTITATDTLHFDYRITDWSPGTVATALIDGTKFELQISSDCGDNYQTVYTINATTHIPVVGLTGINVPLAQFAGNSILIRFKGTWGFGDFWFDLDNINLRACAADMQLTADVTPAAAGQNDGTATANVGLGNPPYQYLWNTAATTQTVTGLVIGAYTVTVTDALGCSNVLTVNIGNSATNEIDGLTALKMQPNPTSGTVFISATFDRTVETNLQVMNMVGQVIWETNLSATNSLTEQVDLSNYPDGLYFVRLSADGQGVTRKLVKSND